MILRSEFGTGDLDLKLGIETNDWDRKLVLYWNIEVWHLLLIIGVNFRCD